MNNLDILNEEVVAPSFELWGKAYVTVWKAALVKGQGKVEFDPVMHKRMVWAIDLSIIPFSGSNARTAERSMIQTSNEWKLTQASIKDLGIEPSEVDQQFVKISFKPTGETYVNAEVKVLSDDSYIVDEYTERKVWQEEVALGLRSKQEYRERFMAESEEDALKAIEKIRTENPSLSDLFGNTEQ